MFFRDDSLTFLDKITERNMKVEKIFLGLAMATASLVITMNLSSVRVFAQPIVPRSVTPRPPLTGAESNVVALFEYTAPSVAYIFTERQEPTGFFMIGTAKGAGSGF